MDESSASSRCVDRHEAIDGDGARSPRDRVSAAELIIAIGVLASEYCQRVPNPDKKTTSNASWPRVGDRPVATSMDRSAEIILARAAFAIPFAP